MWDFPTMSVVVDSKRRVRLPDLVEPQQEYSAERTSPGVIVLRLQQPVEDKPAKVTITMENGYTVGSVDRPIDLDVINRLLDEFP